MVDTHCHVLPGIDDGPKSWEVTLKMCERAVSDGMTHIVATPHFNHRYPYDRHACERRVDELRDKFRSCEFSVGCELKISEQNLEEAVRDPARFTFGSTRYVLVELNEFDLPAFASNALAQIISAGLVPIIAHPERYPIVHRHIELLEEWIGYGCISAITAPSLTGVGGQRIKKFCEMLLKRKLVHIISTDAHDPTRRPPILSSARRIAEKIVGKKDAAAMVWDNPLAVIRGAALN